MARAVTPKVSVTKNYRMFHNVIENRDLELPKHRKLRLSMQEYGFLASFPIVCIRNKDANLEVRDGQHRLAIAETLDLPVYWIEETVDFDIAKVNSTQKPWSILDYATNFSKRGVKSYSDLIEFSEKHTIGLSLSACLLTGNTTFGNVSDQFYRGEFIITELHLAHSVAILYGEFIRADKRLKTSRLVEALLACGRVKGFDNDRLAANVTRCQSKLKPYSTRDAYLGMLEEVYNYHQPKLVPLKMHAIQAMRARNPTAKEAQE